MKCEQLDLKHTGFRGLIGSLRDDFTDMIKKEVTLLKTEVSEKFGAVGKKSGMVAAGGAIALIGALFVLIGLCFLISMGLQKAGLPPQMANWIAFLGFGLIVAVVGFVLMKSSLAALKKTSLAPRETMATLKEMRHPEAMNVVPASAKTDGLSKTQAAKIAVERQIEEVQAEAEALRERLKPKNLMRSGKDCIRRHPVESAAIAGATIGLGLLMRRRHHRRIQIAL